MTTPGSDWPPSRDELRFLLREHALVIQPGEVLIIQVPPDWLPRDVVDLQDALRAYCEGELGIPVMVVPGTAVTVVRRLSAVPDYAG